MTITTRYIMRVQSKNGTRYIHLPKGLVDEWNLKKGDYVEIVVEGDRATIRKL